MPLSDVEPVSWDGADWCGVKRMFLADRFAWCAAHSLKAAGPGAMFEAASSARFQFAPSNSLGTRWQGLNAPLPQRTISEPITRLGDTAGPHDEKLVDRLPKKSIATGVDVALTAPDAFGQTASQPSGAVLPHISGHRLPNGADEIGCLAAERTVLWVTLGVEGDAESARGSFG